MGQSVKSLHFYATVVLVTLILFDEIDSIFSLSLNTEYSESAEHADFTSIEFNEYNIDELQPQSRTEKPHNLESDINDVDVGDFNGNKFGLGRVVSVCMKLKIHRFRFIEPRFNVKNFASLKDLSRNYRFQESGNPIHTAGKGKAPWRQRKSHG